MADKSLYERVQDAATEVVATAAGGATGYYTGRKVESAGGSAAGGAIAGVMASTAAKNFVKEALNRLNQAGNSHSDQAIRDMLDDVYAHQRSLHQLVESMRTS